MPTFECIKSKGVDVTKKYSGQGLNYQDVIVTTLEIFFSNSTDTLSQWESYISTYRTAGTRTAAITIGTITFTNARIIDFQATSSPDGMNNGLRGIITLKIEEIVNGDLSNLTGELADFGIQLAINGKYIEDVEETFSYTVGINNQYDITHSVSVTPNDVTTSSVTGHTLAMTVAKAIGDGYLSSGSNISSIQSTLRGAGVIGSISTSENKITGEATFTRKIATLSNINSGSSATSEYTHNLVLNKNGIINISESGKILALNKDASGHTNLSNAISELPTILTAAASRCSTIYTNSTSAMGVTAGTLNTTKPLETRKNINKISQEVSYTVTYTDDPNIGSSYTTDRELILNQDNNGITEVSERANIMIHGTKGNLSVTPSSAYSTETAGSLGRVQGFLSQTGLSGKTLYGKSSEASYNPNGKNLSYTKSYTTDKNRDPSSGIKKISTVVSDKPPVRMINEYPIAGWKMLAHDPHKILGNGGGRQTKLGERTVTVSCVLDRSVLGGGFLSAPAKPASLTYAAQQVEDELKIVFIDLGLASRDIILTECSYSVDSKRNLTVSATAVYPQEL